MRSRRSPRWRVGECVFVSERRSPLHDVNGVDEAMDVPGVGQIRVFPETRKIVMGSPLDFTRENIGQYWFYV